MISDTLFEAHEDIRRYLDDPFYNDMYPAGELRDRIERLTAEMEAVRAILDAPPKFHTDGIVDWKPGDTVPRII